MTQTIGEAMTTAPRALDAQATVREAARIMLDDGVGDVVVTEGETVREIGRAHV